jgi:hypothetical protein
MPIERAASSIFFWLRRATIASSFLRSYFAPCPLFWRLRLDAPRPHPPPFAAVRCSLVLRLVVV